MPITGFLYHDDFSSKELNPKGYYSLPMKEIVYGINHHGYKGTAVKLGGGELAQTNPVFVNKIIWCRREAKNCIKSIRKLLEIDFSIIGLEPTTVNASNMYYYTIDFIQKYLKKYNKPHIEIYFEEYFVCPERVITRLNSFLGVNINKKKAIENIIERNIICQQPQ